MRRNPGMDLAFVYLTYASTHDYHPYNLRIVPHAGVNSNDFFTLSAAGVTHFVNGVAGKKSMLQVVH